MEDLDSLTTIAEVGAALAGFATLAGILRRDYADRNAAFGVVETSLIAVGFSLLPPVVGNLRVTAALFVIVLAAGFASALLRQRKATGTALFVGKPLFTAVASIVNLAGFAFGLLVALAIYPEHAARLYRSAVLCPLLLACLLLWLTVRSLVFSPEPPESG
jgi:hypothetical protein